MTLNGKGNNVQVSNKLLITLIISCLGWFMLTVWAKADNATKDMQCLLPRTEWAARNVTVDINLGKLREEQATQFRDLREERARDTAQINKKLDDITNYLLNKK